MRVPALSFHNSTPKMSESFGASIRCRYAFERARSVPCNTLGRSCCPVRESIIRVSGLSSRLATVRLRIPFLVLFPMPTFSVTDFALRLFKFRVKFLSCWSVTCCPGVLRFLLCFKKAYSPKRTQKPTREGRNPIHPTVFESSNLRTCQLDGGIALKFRTGSIEINLVHRVDSTIQDFALPVRLQVSRFNIIRFGVLYYSVRGMVLRCGQLIQTSPGSGSFSILSPDANAFTVVPCQSRMHVTVGPAKTF